MLRADQQNFDFHKEAITLIPHEKNEESHICHFSSKLMWFNSCAYRKQNITCICYIFNNGLQNRIDEYIIL